MESANPYFVLQKRKGHGSGLAGLLVGTLDNIFDYKVFDSIAFFCIIVTTASFALHAFVLMKLIHIFCCDLATNLVIITINSGPDCHVIYHCHFLI